MKGASASRKFRLRLRRNSDHGAQLIDDECVTIPASVLTDEIAAAVRGVIAVRRIGLYKMRPNPLPLVLGEREYIASVPPEEIEAFIMDVARNLAQRWITRP